MVVLKVDTSKQHKLLSLIITCTFEFLYVLQVQHVVKRSAESQDDDGDGDAKAAVPAWRFNSFPEPRPRRDSDALQCKCNITAVINDGWHCLMRFSLRCIIGIEYGSDTVVPHVASYFFCCKLRKESRQCSCVCVFSTVLSC